MPEKICLKIHPHAHSNTYTDETINYLKQMAINFSIRSTEKVRRPELKINGETHFGLREIKRVRFKKEVI